jgi:hypothetical protein
MLRLAAAAAQIASAAQVAVRRILRTAVKSHSPIRNLNCVIWSKAVHRRLLSRLMQEATA